MSKVSESRGFHNFTRIGRPLVIHDQRTTYNMSVEAFQQYLNDKMRLDALPSDDGKLDIFVEIPVDNQ